MDMRAYYNRMEALVGESVVLTVVDSKGTVVSAPQRVLIEGAYPAFFLTSRQAPGGSIRESYTYADLITGRVRLGQVA